MLLTGNDIDYLGGVMGLNAEKTWLLIGESEETLLLVLDAISDKTIEENVTKISFPLFAALITMNESKNRKYNLAEKYYASSCLTDFSHLQNISLSLLDSKYLTEGIGKYTLVLLGIFDDIFKKPRNLLPSMGFYAKIGKESFRKSNKENIEEHFDDWVTIFRRMGQKYLLGNQILGRTKNRAGNLENKLIKS